MRIIEGLVQGSPEWHALRSNAIGASMAAPIMGLSPWKNAWELFNDMMGLTPDVDNAAMKRGRDLEPHARALFEQERGKAFTTPVVRHKTLDWMIASLDGLSEDQTEMVEIKTGGRHLWDLALQGKIPEYYKPQIQHQLAVTDLPFAYYYAYDGMDGITIEVPRNEEFIEAMIDMESKFWKRMQDFDPPPMPEDKYVQNNSPRLEQLIEELRHIRKAASREKEIKEEIIQICDGTPTKCAGMRIMKVMSKGSVDYKSIPELQAMDLDKYRKGITESWRILDK